MFGHDLGRYRATYTFSIIRPIITSNIRAMFGVKPFLPNYGQLTSIVRGYLARVFRANFAHYSELLGFTQIYMAFTDFPKFARYSVTEVRPNMAR